jgi:hypothetical protein
MLQALPPPRPLHTQLLWLQHKTFGLNNVEEQFPYQIGWTRIGHLQARPKSAHTKTVTQLRSSKKNIERQIHVLLTSNVTFL